MNRGATTADVFPMYSAMPSTPISKHGRTCCAGLLRWSRLARHGLSLDEAVLRDKSRTLTPRDEETPRLQTILQYLSETLERLEPMLHAAEKPA